MAEEEFEELETLPIGERLRRAREARGLSLDEIAAGTRIPVRHLQHIEAGDWEALPATTYSIGFTRSYANAVGLDGAAIGAELRDQIGTRRAPSVAPEYYEPADPARVPPRSIAIAAAVLFVLLFAGYFIWRSAALPDAPGERIEIAEAEQPDPAAPAPGAEAPLGGPAAGPQNVVLTAVDEIWLRVYDGTAANRLYEGTLQPGQRFEVPTNAERPMILTGRPQALRVTVGNTEIPPLGAPERTISNVSLLPEDLLARTRGGGAQPAAQPQPTGQPTPQ